jgi:hypothetical protein
MERNPWFRALIVLLVIIAAIYVLQVTWAAVMVSDDVATLLSKTARSSKCLPGPLARHDRRGDSNSPSHWGSANPVKRYSAEIVGGSSQHGSPASGRAVGARH